MKARLPRLRPIGDRLACHQSNAATNTAAFRDEREGFPKTPGLRHQTGERHAGREIEGERGRASEGGERRGALEWCQVPKVAYKYL